MESKCCAHESHEILNRFHLCFCGVWVEGGGREDEVQQRQLTHEGRHRNDMEFVVHEEDNRFDRFCIQRCPHLVVRLPAGAT